jgi:hypothetical protein
MTVWVALRDRDVATAGEKRRQGCRRYRELDDTLSGMTFRGNWRRVDGSWARIVIYTGVIWRGWSEGEGACI